MKRIMREHDRRYKASPYNEAYRIQKMPREVRSAFFNHFTIWHEFFEQKTAGLLQDLEDKHKGEPCLVLASGPTLDELMPLIKDWKGGIICTFSQASTCLYYGRKPDYIIALDINHKPNDPPVPDGWEGTDVPLILHPCMEPLFVQWWPGKKYYYRPIEPNTEFYTDTLRIAYEFITSFMYLFSCSTSAEIGIATLLGYDPIFLCGCDYGEVKESFRFHRWYYAKGKMKLGKEKWRNDQRGEERVVVKKRIIAESGHITNHVKLYHLKSFMMILRLDKPRVINTSFDNILAQHIPTTEIRKVIEQQGEGFEELQLTVDQQIEISEDYLAKRGTFVIPMKAVKADEDPLRFVECGKNARAELKGTLEVYVKSGCSLDVDEMMERLEGRIKLYEETIAGTAGSDK